MFGAQTLKKYINVNMFFFVAICLFATSLLHALEEFLTSVSTQRAHY